MLLKKVGAHHRPQQAADPLAPGAEDRAGTGEGPSCSVESSLLCRKSPPVEVRLLPNHCKHLIVLLGEVARENISETLDVWKLLVGHTTKPGQRSNLTTALFLLPGDTVLEGDNVVKVLSWEERKALQLLTDGIEGLADTHCVHCGLQMKLKIW